MISQLKYLLEDKIKIFYYILSLNIISLIFELLCLISVPFFVSSIFSPSFIIDKFNYYGINEILNFSLNEENIVFVGIFFLISSFLFKNFFLIYIYFFQGSFLKNVKINLEKKIFNYYIKSNFINHNKNNPANILRNINDEVMGFYNYTYHFFLLIREILTLVLIFIIFTFTSYKAAITISIFLFILIFLYLKYIRPSVKVRSENNQIFRKNMSQSIIETFRAIQDIKIYNKEKYVQKNFMENVNKFEQNHFIFGLMGKLPRVVLEIISVLVGLIFILAIINSNVQFDNDTLVLLAFFAIGIIRFIPAFNAVTVSINYLKIFKASVKLLVNEIKKFNYINSQNQIIRDDFKLNSKNKSYIYVDDISFDYGEDSPFKLQKFSFELKSGKKVAIVGKTGSGKSTFNYLLNGLITPKQGNIFYKGKNIEKIKKVWEKKIGYVSQNIFLFNSSIQNNITMFASKKNIDQKRLSKAVKISNLEEKIKSLSNGLDSMVGVDGLSLSGGERQRIAIARAIYKDPEILFLDEFTSSLDNKTKAKILQKLFRHFISKNIFLITHDLKIAKKCDEILHVNKGIIKRI